MCAIRFRRFYNGAYRDPDRKHPHPARYPFYLPPPYARYLPYDPYAAYHYADSFYQSPCYAQRDITKEETAFWSWPVILFLILLVIVLIGIVYRGFSRETRRKIALWLRLHRFQQTSRMETKQDATQNCPLEFLRSTERNGDDGRVEDLGESSSLTDAMITKTLVNPDYEEEDDEDDRHRSEDDESNQNAIIEQMDALADTKSVGEERYARAKQENATLQARILMLEEAAKDAETRAEERLQTEQRRHREWAGRLERERQLQLENYAIKLQAAELDSSSLRDEIARVREQLERARVDKTRFENDFQDTRREADAARESERHAISRANEAHHQLDAMREELSLRSEDQQRLEELVQQVVQLQARNKSLEESRDELQAAAALQAGRELLMLNPCNNNAEKGPSLAVELLAGMNPDQLDGEFSEPCTMAELKQALKEQQEVNTQLRTYIDGILLNIVENYPQLLEVKQIH